MCSNQTQLLRNLRSFGATAGENRSHRLWILFCTRPVYKNCGQELAELGHPLPILGVGLWVGEREERRFLLHHASSSLRPSMSWPFECRKARIAIAMTMRPWTNWHEMYCFTLLENSAVWMTESNLEFLTRLFLVEFHANISIVVETKEIFKEISW